MAIGSWRQAPLSRGRRKVRHPVQPEEGAPFFTGHTQEQAEQLKTSVDNYAALVSQLTGKPPPGAQPESAKDVAEKNREASGQQAKVE